MSNPKWDHAPIKVDLVYGLDGMEIKEVIQALREKAARMQDISSFQAENCENIARKCEQLFYRRQETLLHFLLTRELNKGK